MWYGYRDLVDAKDFGYLNHKRDRKDERTGKMLQRVVKWIQIGGLVMTARAL